MSDDPEDLGIVNARVEIVQYLDTEGNLSRRIRTTGEVPLSTFVGLLELSKLDIVEEAKEWESDE